MTAQFLRSTTSRRFSSAPDLGIVATSTTAALAAVGNAINTTGKYQGRVVYNTTTKKLVTADGATAGSIWVDATGVTAHTPV